MSALGHLMIMASAGSGKTYALTTRFVRLLALGAPPARIVALTFTRKAAGEFFDAILNRLAEAATEEKAAAKLAQEVAQPQLCCADFLRFLEEVVAAMPQLNLGTLDGFFARMVQAFPLELGLSGEFELLEDAAARQERQRVLGLIFAVGVTSAQARDDFIESFKRATYGVEEKSLQRSLDSFLDQHGEAYRSAPIPAAWGNAAMIWPEGGPVKSADDFKAVARRLEGELDRIELTENQRRRLVGFFGELGEWVAGAALPKDVDYVVKNTLDVADALRAGQGEVMVERKRLALNPDLGRLWLAVVEAIVAAELNRRLEITRGIHDVLAYYESVYHDQVRRAGRLTFADVQRLLEPGDERGLGPEQRQLIDWRLDAQFDHWLLDEFQDTSRGQWSILSNLVDEAVQDAEGARSFFYVGDVKQAIYAWRGGDSRLFREIFTYYNAAAPGAIAEAHLATSWRSAPPVIELVNRVCGDESALQAIAPSEAVARWMADWRQHESANAKAVGYATLREADDEAGRFAETLSILREIDPAGRGLTAAVLVQKNDTGTRLAEYLRAEGGVAAVAESDLLIAFDNPLTSALLALLKSAAHPGDTMATELVGMTPLAQVLRDLGWTTASDVTAGVLREVHAGGFAGMLTDWGQRLEPHLRPDDAFSRLRGRQLIEAARAFDQRGERSVARFIEWAESYRLREVVSPGVIRVLTVHKAKGLGFDVVILPDLQGQSIAQRRDGLAIHRDATHAVDWVLDLPVRRMAESDPVLREQIEGEIAEGAYEALCKLYVALTRAKQALYVIIEPVGRSRSKNFPMLLEKSLTAAWSAGDPDWFRANQREPGEDVELPGLAFSADEAIVRRKRRLASTPSKGRPLQRSGDGWFQASESRSTAQGTLIHAELARIEWGEDLDLPQWTDQRLADGADPTAIEVLRTSLESERLSTVFTRPPGRAGVEVWRERAFEVVLKGDWVSGIFDRVVVQFDAQGHAARAWIYDFKTHEIETRESAEIIAQHYDQQMKLYREVVKTLTGLPLDKIKAELVFTAMAIRIEMG